MAQAFKVGDVVRLKSDGPKMTVIYISEDGTTISCTWFVSSGSKPETGSFPAEALEVVTESSEPLQTRANTGRPRRT